MSRPPFETFKGATCKGSYALDSACGQCERCEWERAQMAKPDLASTLFEQFASERGHDIAPTVFPAPDRVYADRFTQELFEAWNAGAASGNRE